MKRYNKPKSRQWHVIKMVVFFVIKKKKKTPPILEPHPTQKMVKSKIIYWRKEHIMVLISHGVYITMKRLKKYKF